MLTTPKHHAAPPAQDEPLIGTGARTIYHGFDTYQSQFQAITLRAWMRFDQRDREGMQADKTERLEWYNEILDQVVTQVRKQLEERLLDKALWTDMKTTYSGLIAGRTDCDLGETFFNSVTRRIFDTVGVDPAIEFIHSDFGTPPPSPHRPIYRVFQRTASTAALIEQVLTDYYFKTPYIDAVRDAGLVAEEIEHHLRQVGRGHRLERVELISKVFYRDMGAYLVGRMYYGPYRRPLVLALLNEPNGILVDAVLLNEDEVSILFSFAHSYFHVEVERPFDLIRFLKSLMPRKRVAELYISLGHNRHGKTELYRDLRYHLAHSNDQFVIAEGQRGMVMDVFTLPSFDVVFKIFKDRFDYPKSSTQAQVKSRYRLVHHHDRAGRLVDVQEFEHLQISRARFSDELLEELLRIAGNTVRLEDDQVVITYTYVERRVTPLDVYLAEADEDRACAAIVEYGNAIKDLAATNIFPGDLLLKNFGVTRHGRVVFYDYDEICLLTSCHFRKKPESRSYEEELSDQPWFYVGPDDVFPEEFEAALGLQGAVREAFMAHHADLFGIAFWHTTQERLAAGEIIPIFPYGPGKHLHRTDDDDAVYSSRHPV